MTTPRRSFDPDGRWLLRATKPPGGATPSYAEAIAAVGKSQDELSRCRVNAPSGAGGMTAEITVTCPRERAEAIAADITHRHGVTTAYWDGYQLTVKSCNIRDGEGREHNAGAAHPEGGAR
ncbi:hypothetical protein DSM43518_02072 [Mycobacterium marinum]|uniref:hypothetical protein n=1 Tax=Mycobacterium marinum TaxID=1781 RepID=UPI000E3E956C|nr:hypothetical protein [Mycobacterium marinum]RFZ11232.1 hypothetical protein DSM43518_02072 [Mycobacterium marinum]